MLTEWQRVFMHDNRREVEECTESSDAYIDTLLEHVNNMSELDDNVKHFFELTGGHLKRINKKLRDNLDKFEDAIMRGNDMHDPPDPNITATPYDYMREDVKIV